LTSRPRRLPVPPHQRRHGRGQGRRSFDIAALNAAAALVVAGRAEKLDSGMDLAREALDSGAAQRTLKKLVACSRHNP